MKKFLIIISVLIVGLLNAANGISPDVSEKLKAYNDLLKKNQEKSVNIDAMSRQEKSSLDSAKANLSAYRSVVATLLKQYSLKQSISDSRITKGISGNQSYITVSDIVRKEYCDEFAFTRKAHRELTLHSQLLYAIRLSEDANSITAVTSEAKMKINNLLQTALATQDTTLDISEYYDFKEGQDFCKNARIVALEGDTIIIGLK